MANYLQHHGIKGQRWGVRRYQDDHGNWTDEGLARRKAYRGNKEAMIEKDHRVYRVSSNDKSDLSENRTYVNVTPDHKDFYTVAFGGAQLLEKGKLYAHEYIANNNLKVPDRKTTEKIELGLMKDPDVRSEVIDSLANKGYSIAEAKAYTQAYSTGRAVLQGIKNGTVGALVGGFYGGVAGMYTLNPFVAAGSAAVGAATGAIAGGIGGAKAEKQRALNAARVSYGDVENVKLNKKLNDELNKRGYNAVKDYNDRRAYKKQGEDAAIVMESNKNLKDDKITRIDRDAYAKAYANAVIDMNPKMADTRKNLETQGGKVYDRYMEEGALYRKQKAEREKAIKDAQISEGQTVTKASTKDEQSLKNATAQAIKGTELEKYYKKYGVI